MSALASGDPVTPSSRPAPAGIAPPRRPPQAQPLPGLHVAEAASAAEFRAAGYLRACSLYTVPKDRSEFAARVRRRGARTAGAGAGGRVGWGRGRLELAGGAGKGIQKAVRAPRGSTGPCSGYGRRRGRCQRAVPDLAPAAAPRAPAAQAHRRMKGDAEWEAVTNKVAGEQRRHTNTRRGRPAPGACSRHAAAARVSGRPLHRQLAPPRTAASVADATQSRGHPASSTSSKGADDTFKQMRVTCFVATIPDDSSDPVAAQVGHEARAPARVACACRAGRAPCFAHCAARCACVRRSALAAAPSVTWAAGHLWLPGSRPGVPRDGPLVQAARREQSRQLRYQRRQHERQQRQRRRRQPEQRHHRQRPGAL